ncbi:MAG: pseudouridine synthase [Chloroflexota bacterium]|nr:pseudouridine synthase [Chloroflexota bacterium]
MSTTPLLKALTDTGIGSRRWLADAIRQGRVTVNGDVVEDFRHEVAVETDLISIDQRQIDLKPQRSVYLLLNKPKGIVSTTHDERGRKTVIDILPEKYRHLRLYPIGRLDKDSTGLLLLTNDGTIAHRLTHPSFEHEKVYLVSVNGKLKGTEKQRLQHGIKLEEGITTHSANVEEVRLPPFNYRITLHEGRKRQIRRMFASLGYRVLALKRVSMANIQLGDLPEGNVRQLSQHDLQSLLDDITD